MNDFINTLDAEFRANSNDQIALGQKAYMKNQFEFLGIKSPIRKEIQRPFLVTKYLQPKKDLENIVKKLWEKPGREFQYFAQEFAFKYANQLEIDDVELFEFMIINKSWWDTVDFISAKLVGNYFKIFPEKQNITIEKWLKSNNIWLQRSSILFQLKYKNNLDTDFLSYIINSLLGSKEFFINKAIGWILREYSKTNPDWVISFAENTELSNLSYREALRLIKYN